MVKKIAPVDFPNAVAVSYERGINKLIYEAGKEMFAVFNETIAPNLVTMQGDSQRYMGDGPFNIIMSAINKIKVYAANAFTARKVKKAAESFAVNLNQVNKRNLNRQAKVKGVNPAREQWLAKFLEEHVEKNVSYITNIHDDYAQKIENIILNGVKNGETARQMREKLVAQIGMSKNRAKFVAVDQTGSILGQLTAKRHQDMGVSRFRWRTSKDERVRDSHRELENKIFSYDDPPAVGLPGTDFHCRCIAIPIFEDEE